MRARSKSILRSMGAGALLGAIALAARYAPAPAPAREAGAGPRPAPPRRAQGSPLTPALAPTSSFAPAVFSAAVSSSSASAPPEPGACPEGMALVEGDYCPELKYSCVRPADGAGCGEYARGSRCRGALERRRYCIDRYEWPNRVGEEPRVYVDWFEAKALCRAEGKRLCRRSEWVLACEGPKRMPYPWGFVRQPSPCNIDRAAIPADVEAIVDDRTRDEEIARLWQADRIGSHPDCTSAYGVYDMAGNVDEWTDDRADDPSSKHPATLNGGYWGPVRNTCRLATTSHGPTFKFYQVGFRCCADAR